MRSLLITLGGVGLMLIAQLAPSTPLINDQSFTYQHKVEALDMGTHSEMESLAIVPVYCADYIKLYDWNHTVAHNVMMIESKNIARNLNDNPVTGDYSVGCFQINLLGGNQTAKYKLAVSLGYSGANTRESLREWLWEPGNNVKLAYTMWKGQGWQPWSFTTCKKTACY